MKFKLEEAVWIFRGFIDYEWQALLLFRKNGVNYFTIDSGCSCNDMEGSYEAEQLDKDEFIQLFNKTIEEDYYYYGDYNESQRKVILEEGLSYFKN